MAKTSEYLEKGRLQICHPWERDVEKLTPTPPPPIEHPNLRVFCIMQGNIKRQLMLPIAPPYAIYDGMLTGAMSLYLSTPRADYLKGSLVCENCK